MPVLDQFRRVPLTDILIDRDSRQRREIDVSDLVPSVRARGVIQPIVVEGRAEDAPPYRLIAGERRCEASRQAGLPDIPVRFSCDLSRVELRIIELEENVKRKDLPWQDAVAGLAEIHLLYTDLDPDWTQGETADSLGLSVGTVSLWLKVHGQLTEGRIQTASTVREAYNILTRRDQRAMGNALEELIGVGTSVVSQASPDDEPLDEPQGEAQSANAGHISDDGRVIAAARAPDLIQVKSFLEWAPQYSGQKFNLVHCDFPYGVDLFGTKDTRQMKKVETYDDQAGTFFELLECFCTNLDRFMSLSGHLMFWYSEKHGDATRECFARLAPSLELQIHPLIWVKSDNAGLVEDVRRKPRHVYETCLLASRGDRHLVAPKADAYSSPTDKTLHPSTKPEPMLRHFMGMLVDVNTTCFDPTAGSGAALRAADSLGATKVFGLEINPETAALANTALNNSRKLRSASEALK